MTPPYMLRQFRFVRPGLDESDPMKQVLLAERRALPGCQLSRQCRDNLFAAGCSFLAKDVLPDSCADVPVHEDQFCVYGSRDPLAR